MRKLLIFGCVTVAIMSVLIPARSTSAQGIYGDQAPGTVMGTGTTTLKRQPKLMRVQVALLAKGSDMQKALTMLEDRSAAARAQLTALGAPKDAIKIGEPRTSSEKTDEQRQMEMMMAQRLRKGRRGQPKSSSVTVTAMLTAEFPLEASDVKEMLAQSYSLQQKIRAGDIGGLGEAEKLSPEEQEIMEELEEQTGGMYGYSNSGQKPGEPVFTFVSPISEDEHQQALAEAFNKAKTSAEQLARAAGMNLGKLSSLSNHLTTGDSNYSAYDQYAYQMRMANATEEDQSDKLEATSSEAGPVTYGVTVAASFVLAE